MGFKNCIFVLSMVAVSSSAAFAQDRGALTDPEAAQPANQPADDDSGGADWPGQKADNEAQKAAFDAAKAAFDARKAAIEAEQGAIKAKFGGVTGQSTITGTVNTGTGTAKAEALLLVTRATQQAATDAAAALQNGLDVWAKERSLIVLTDMTELSTTEAMVFQVQSTRFATLLTSADRMCRAALNRQVRWSKGEGANRMAPLVAAGAILDSVAKLGSYFQSDYSFSGVEFTEPSNLTAASIVGALRRRMTTPIIIPANLVASDPSGVAGRLAQLDALHSSVSECAAEAKAAAAASRSVDPSAAAVFDAGEAVATRTAGAYETFATTLTASTGDQAPPLVRIVRQQIVQRHLAQKPLILLVTSQKAAAMYTKKNLWTFLGGPPLYTMGGVSMVFTLFDPVTGNVIAAGAIAKHGGYRSVGSVERLFR